jgi:excisionase family DNA binding protein
MQAEPAQPRSHQEWSDDQRQEEDNGQPAGMGLAEFPDVGRVEEVAAVLRCSKWCVYDLINTGALKSIRLGRAIRVTRRALEEFLSL